MIMSLFLTHTHNWCAHIICTFMPIIWQLLNASNHTDTGQDFQLMFISNIRRGWFTHFINLLRLSYTVALEFTHKLLWNILAKQKVSQFCRQTHLKVRAEYPDWFDRQERYSNSNNHSSQLWWVEKHLRMHKMPNLEVDELQQQQKAASRPTGYNGHRLIKIGLRKIGKTNGMESDFLK